MASKKIEERMEHAIAFVLLGKPGSGKSRTGNTITCCDKAFVFGWQASGISQRCESISTDLLERRVCVIDTPGVSKFEKNEYDDVKEFISKVGANKIIFLLCVSVGRFTQEERLLIDQYYNFFGEDFVENTIIIFTHLDEWEADMEDRCIAKVTFDKYLMSLPEETKRIIDRFHGRYLSVNNKQKETEKMNWRKRLLDMASSIDGRIRLSDDTKINNTSLLQTVIDMSLMASRQTGDERESVTTFVLLGKTGSGKSRTGNTITGLDKKFEFSGNASSTTQRCESQLTDLFGRSVCVIDTPGVSKFEEKEYADVKAFISKVRAGKIIFLLCVSVGKFTPEERLLVDQYFKFFGDDFAQNTIIIFTHVDELESDMKDHNVENFDFDNCLRTMPDKETNRIIKLFHNRYLTVNNKQIESKKMHWREKLVEISNSVQGFTILSEDSILRNTSLIHSVPDTSSKVSNKIMTFVLLGKAGSGKSRTGNTITGCDKTFEFGGLSYSTPKKCESKSIELFEQSVCVIDTPGVSKFEEKEYADVKAFISKVGAGKIIFLLCVSVGRFTPEERLLIDQYFKFFGADFAKNTIIIFTHLDEWEADMEDRGGDVITFNSYLQSLPGETKCILERFHNLYLTVNNKQAKREKMHWKKKLIDMATALEGLTIRCTETTTGNTSINHSESKSFVKIFQKKFCCRT